ASQYQGQERERFLELVQQEPMFAAQLRAPLYEDKVVDFLFGKAEITDRKGTREQLEADLESEEGHVHGPGCGHDHGAAEKPKGKKAAAKKSAPKPEEVLATAKPAKAAKKVELTEEAKAKPKPAKPLKSEPANTAAAKAADKPKAKASAKPAPKAKAEPKPAPKAKKPA